MGDMDGVSPFTGQECFHLTLINFKVQSRITHAIHPQW